ncbi:unnamed protein product, partial [Ectocarpus sp. 8 AP-2014]
VDFARRVLLDLLFLFEKRRRLGPARSGSRRNQAERQQEQEALLSKDPSAELLCAVMDTLDGSGGLSGAPGPAATTRVPGLVEPLVGFWGVFLDVVSGGPSTFLSQNASSGGGGGNG